MFMDIFGPEHWWFHQDCNSCENVAYVALGMAVGYVWSKLCRAVIDVWYDRKEQKEGLV